MATQGAQCGAGPFAVRDRGMLDNSRLGVGDRGMQITMIRIVDAALEVHLQVEPTLLVGDL